MCTDTACATSAKPVVWLLSSCLECATGWPRATPGALESTLLCMVRENGEGKELTWSRASHQSSACGMRALTSWLRTHDTQAEDADRRRALTDTEVGVRGLERADYMGEVEPAWLGKLGGEDYGDEDFVDPAILRRGAQASGEVQGQACGFGGSTEGANDHQEIALDAGRRADGQWRSLKHLLDPDASWRANPTSSDDDSQIPGPSLHDSSEEGSGQQGQAGPERGDEGGKGSWSEGSSEARKRAYVEGHGPQTAAELYLQYALADG